jgi:hypothetical protein
MIERMAGVPAGIDALRPVGKVSRDDYDAVVLPVLEAAIRDGRGIRALVQIDDAYEGVTPGGMWEDLKIGLRALHHWAGCAVVSNLGWVRESIKLAAFFMPAPVRVFDETDREQAIAWLQTLPEHPGITHRILTEAGAGIVVVEATGPLRVPDFDALALTIDSWLEHHAELQGLVLHARAFPGWENLTALVGHLRFVRDHHHAIAKVALALDGTLAHLAPHVATHFVHAQVRHFDYDQLDNAITWAATPN